VPDGSVEFARFFPADRENQGKNRSLAQKSNQNQAHNPKFIPLAGKNFSLLAAWQGNGRETAHRRPAALMPMRRILGDLVLIMAKARVLTILAIYQTCIRAV
jgi:hypothetical protein